MIQIETAMGAAIEVFEGAAAIEVDRDRFLPVKTTNDLLVLRSDVYDARPTAPPRARPTAGRRCRSSTSTRDYYKLVGDFDERFPEGAPSLRQAEQLSVEGDWTFGADVTVVGDASLDGDGGRVDAVARSARLAVVTHARAMPTDRLARVDEHLERILDGARAAAALRPAAAGGPRAAGLRGRRRADGPAGLRQLRDGRLRRAAPTTSPTRRRGPPGAPAGRRRDRRPARPAASRCRPGTAVRIMTGAPVPAGADASCRSSGPTAASRRSDHPGAPSSASTSGPPARTSQTGDLLLEDGHACSGRASSALLAAVGRAAGPVAAASAGRGHVDRLRAARAGHAARPRLDLRRATPTCSPPPRARPARSPTASASSPTTRARSPTRCRDQLVRADLVVTSGGVSMGDYDVVKEVLRRLGTVWFGEVAMQPGKPQGFGIVGEDATPIFTLPGNPVSSYVSFEVFVLPAIRRMMGRPPYRRPMVRAACCRRSRSPPDGAVRPRQFEHRRPRRARRAGGRARLAPDRRPRRGQRAGRRAGGGHLGAGGSQVQVLVLDRDF